MNKNDDTEFLKNRLKDIEKEKKKIQDNSIAGLIKDGMKQLDKDELKNLSNKYILSFAQRYELAFHQILNSKNTSYKLEIESYMKKKEFNNRFYTEFVQEVIKLAESQEKIGPITA